MSDRLVLCVALGVSRYVGVVDWELACVKERGWVCFMVGLRLLCTALKFMFKVWYLYEDGLSGIASQRLFRRGTTRY